MSISICGSPPIFLDNKYTKWYIELCSSRRSLRRDCYVEKHHIWPTKCGGSNAPENVVKLTGEEHFVAHWLLTKMMVLPGDKRKMCFALSFFATKNKNHQRRLTAKEYEVVRKALSEARKGVPPSANCRAAVSKAKKGIPLTPEEKLKIGLALTKRRRYWARSPDGKEYTGSDLRELVALGLKYNTIVEMQPGNPKIITSGKNKGWIIADEKIENAEELVLARLQEAKLNRKEAVTATWDERSHQLGTAQGVKLISPAGETFTFRTLQEMQEKLQKPASTIQTAPRGAYTFTQGVFKGWQKLQP